MLDVQVFSQPIDSIKIKKKSMLVCYLWINEEIPAGVYPCEYRGRNDSCGRE